MLFLAITTEQKTHSIKSKNLNILNLIFFHCRHSYSPQNKLFQHKKPHP